MVDRQVVIPHNSGVADSGLRICLARSSRFVADSSHLPEDALRLAGGLSALGVENPSSSTVPIARPVDEKSDGRRAESQFRLSPICGRCLAAHCIRLPAASRLFDLL